MGTTRPAAAIVLGVALLAAACTTDGDTRDDAADEVDPDVIGHISVPDHLDGDTKPVDGDDLPPAGSHHAGVDWSWNGTDFSATDLSSGSRQTGGPGSDAWMAAGIDIDPTDPGTEIDAASVDLSDQRRGLLWTVQDDVGDGAAVVVTTNLLGEPIVVSDLLPASPTTGGCRGHVDTLGVTVADQGHGFDADHLLDLDTLELLTPHTDIDPAHDGCGIMRTGTFQILAQSSGGAPVSFDVTITDADGDTITEEIDIDAGDVGVSGPTAVADDLAVVTFQPDGQDGEGDSHLIDTDAGTVTPVSWDADNPISSVQGNLGPVVDDTLLVTVDFGGIYAVDTTTGQGETVDPPGDVPHDAVAVSADDARPFSVWSSDHGDMLLFAYEHDGTTTIAGVTTDLSEEVFAYSVDHLPPSRADEQIVGDDRRLLATNGYELSAFDPAADEVVWTHVLTGDQQLLGTGRDVLVLVDPPSGPDGDERPHDLVLLR